MKYMILALLFATELTTSMEKSANPIALLKKQAEVLSAKLREESLNSSGEYHGSYKSFNAQTLEDLRLQIQAHEQIETN